MLSQRLRSEMVFYATTDDYRDAERYERFARDCKLDEKAFEIGLVVKALVLQIQKTWWNPVEILETASATGLTAVGVKATLERAHIKHVYTLLDIEKSLLDYAKARGRGDVFVLGDFEDLPFASETFHIYIMMGAEGYRTNKETFYAEVKRVLRRGGYFIMPQIGPQPIVSNAEKDSVLKSGLEIIQADSYLIARKC
ncbi:MAG: class I SAM-dependent methyltransferase [bacterium]|nr:class I SAM-dependent methyltransferase [bacterium]